MYLSTWGFWLRTGALAKEEEKKHLKRVEFNSSSPAVIRYQMKFCSLIFWLLLTLVSLAYPIEELICPDSSPENCYPKSFKPTKEWQVVREGQEIPPGLHIRFDMDTQSRQAKLLDPEENPGLQLVQIADVVPEIQENQQVISHKPNKRISSEDKSEFSNSIHTLQNYVLAPQSIQLKYVFDSLSLLEELSHDLDFGIKISEIDTFSTLLEMSELLPSNTFDITKLTLKDSQKLKDICFRIIAASLRNNPIALQNVLKSDQKPSYVINSLLNHLSAEDSAVIQKRILGILTAIVQNYNGVQLFNLNDGQNKILIAFNKLSSDGQLRALQLLDDLNDNIILKRSEDGIEEDLTQDEIDKKFFSILKNRLVENSSHPDFKKLFIQLVQLKEKSKAKIKADSDFLNWLTDERTRRKQNPELVKRDNEDREHGDSGSFDEYMLKVRHVVFGNPMGFRKDAADEL